MSRPPWIFDEGLGAVNTTRAPEPTVRNAIHAASVADPAPEDLRAELRRLALLGCTKIRLNEVPEPDRSALKRLVAFANDKVEPVKTGPLFDLAERLKLSPIERTLIAATLAVDVEPGFARLWRLLSEEQPGIAATSPRLSMLLGLLHDDAAAVLELLRPDHILRALGLVELSIAQADSPLAGRLVARAPLCSLVLGGKEVGGDGVTFVRPQGGLADVFANPRKAEELIWIARTSFGHSPSRRAPSSLPPTALLLIGPSGSGREYTAEALALALGLNLARLKADESNGESVGTLARGALIRDAVACITLSDAAPRRISELLAPLAKHYAGPLFIIAPSPLALPEPWHAWVITHQRPDRPRRAELWRKALSGVSGFELLPGQIEDLVDRFALGCADIFTAVRNAKLSAGLRGGIPTLEMLISAAELHSRSGESVPEYRQSD